MPIPPSEIAHVEADVRRTVEAAMPTKSALLTAARVRGQSVEVDVAYGVTGADLAHPVLTLKLCRNVDFGWMLTAFQIHDPACGIQFPGLEAHHLLHRLCPNV